MPPKILAHFRRADPILYKVMISVGSLQELPHRQGSDLFLDLVDAIVGQQLSGKAADAIFARFKALFPRGKITPVAVLKISDDKIRATGISYPKIKYIKDLATKVKSGQVDLDLLRDLPDVDVIDNLTLVKGIGKWTAEMFLIFTLRREDVFSHGDLGLNNAMKKIYKMEKYVVSDVEKIISAWSPFKSYASRVLWKSLDNR